MFPTLEKYIEQEYKKAGISIKVPKSVKEEIDKKTRDIFALTNRGVIATFTNLPEFINDIKSEYKKWKKTRRQIMKELIKVISKKLLLWSIVFNTIYSIADYWFKHKR